jgi:hypothetical protein
MLLINPNEFGIGLIDAKIDMGRHAVPTMHVDAISAMFRA